MSSFEKHSVEFNVVLSFLQHRSMVPVCECVCACVNTAHPQMAAFICFRQIYQPSPEIIAKIIQYEHRS